MIDPLVTIVIPAFNERSALEEHLPHWVHFCESRGWKIILVDDGSTDGTRSMLESSRRYENLLAFQHKANRGYGSALKTGLLEVTTPIAVTMDADGQHLIEDIDVLIDHMWSTDSDMVVGSRKGTRERNLYRRFGKAIIRRITRLLFSTTIYDLNSGLKIYRSKYVKPLLMYTPDSMAFSDIVTLLHLQSGLRVTEHPIRVEPRSSGKSTIRTMTAFQTVMEILNVVMWFSPSKIFLPISAALFIFGVIWATPFLIRGSGLSTTALLLITSGVIGFMLGLLAEQLASIRKSGLPQFDYELLQSTAEDLEPNSPDRK